MPQLMIYDKIPEHFYYQAQAFSRIIWYDSDRYDIDLELDAPMTHIVLANGKSLISYAQVLSKTINHEGTVYNCYGISGMMTFPFFRKRGYGGQVVEAAISVMQDNKFADIALLWTESHNQQFYKRYGWQTMPTMTTLIGNQSQPDVYDEEGAMMLFLSDQAKQSRSKFENESIYVGEEQW